MAFELNMKDGAVLSPAETVTFPFNSFFISDGLSMVQFNIM